MEPEKRHKVGCASIVSVALLAFLTTAYLVRSDGLYAVTIWPPIAWLLIPFLLFLISLRKKNRFRRGLVVLWLLFFLVFSEEPLALWHSIVAGGKANLTVVTLNCAGGSPEAAAEVAAYHPDIVLLQESPSEQEVAKLASRLYGDQAAHLHGVDASILVRGTLEPIELPKGTGDFVAAHATLAGGQKLAIVSLRLQPPIFRLDYWNPACWQDYAENRRLRREELLTIAEFIRAKVGNEPILLGGDFNTPPDPGVTGCLTPELRDAYPESGTLWGYTAVNEFPLARIDQIWVSQGFSPISTTAFKTVNSDHRLVRCHLKVE